MPQSFLLTPSVVVDDDVSNGASPVSIRPVKPFGRLSRKCLDTLSDWLIGCRYLAPHCPHLATQSRPSMTFDFLTESTTGCGFVSQTRRSVLTSTRPSTPGWQTELVVPSAGRRPSRCYESATHRPATCGRRPWPPGRWPRWVSCPSASCATRWRCWCYSERATDWPDRPPVPPKCKKTDVAIWRAKFHSKSITCLLVNINTHQINCMSNTF